MNDTEVTIMFHVPGKQLINENATVVDISANFNGKEIPKEQNEIEAIWTKRKNDNPKLYNGSKFRIDAVTYKSGNDHLLEMKVGLTCYKDFIGTNWSPNAKSLLQLGKFNCNNTQAYMSDAMGVGAFVKTVDNKVIFLKRSMYCGEAAGLWDIPGGHAEPQELVGKIPYEEIDIEKLDPKAVAHEIYDSILREVIDEVNIPRSSLTDPEMLGIARNQTAAGRPSIEFLINESFYLLCSDTVKWGFDFHIVKLMCSSLKGIGCSLTSKEVLDLYNKGTHAEAEESTKIRIIPVEDIINMTTEDDFWKNMAPSSKGCLMLYRKYQDILHAKF